MKKPFTIILLSMILVSCQGISVNEKKSTGHVTTGGGTSGGATSGTTVSLPYTDSFSSDGPLTLPWAQTFSGEPVPSVTSGEITATASNSAYIPALITTNVYSEIEFQNPSGATAYNFTLVNRYDHINHSAVWCSFQMLSGSVTLTFMAMMNGNIMSSGPVTLPVTSSDTAIHKAGCLIETSGPDVVMYAFLDPSVSNTTQAGTFNLVGFDSILPSGSPALVIEDNLGLLVLDNFKVYATFPY